MATFTSFNSRLPDPTFGVTDAGSVASDGVRGPGFAEVSVTSTSPSTVSRTNSGRGVHRGTGAHFWSISISYHPMLRYQFDTVASFLELRGGKLKPFFVVLPQYSRPRDPGFATFAINNEIKTATANAAGSPSILVQASSPIVGSSKPGDFFTISDPNDINHLKTYKVAAVETATTYQSGTSAPATNQLRIHTTPPLTRFTAVGSTINFIDPKFRVYQTSDVLETRLSTDNLYSFGLNLEEILP